MKAVPIFTEDEIQYMLDNLDQYSPEEQAEIDKIADVLSKRSLTERCRKDLIAFCLHMQPDYKVGKHHRILADTLMATAKGEKDRVCVNIAPRHGKSQLTSIYFPAWFIGNYPNTKLLMVSHTTDLAVDFGRKVRNLIDTDEYRSIFPDVHLASDSKSAGRWNTTTGNEYYACGVGSALAGRGADLLLIDDPHNEQDIINGNFEVFDKAYEWFTYGARTRLMPGGRVALVMTRWHQSDLTGRVTNDMAQNELADKYEVIEFPAIMEVPVSKDSTETVEKPLWPEFFDLKALHRTRASMPVFQWNAQYQQNPTSEEASIIKREWWNTWLKDDPPECEYIIMTLDAAAETHNRADFTAITTWGVFMNNSHDGPGLGTYNIILLNAIKKRIEFTDLKELALSEYKYWNPDSFIVEKKSSGTALYQEFRRMGIPVQEYTPHRGSGDKLARLNSVADIVKSGLCWVPQTRWAEEVVEEIAGFPFMAHDDLCVAEDTMVLMATGEEVPITKVRVGDYVQTPIGPRKVLSSHCTGVKNTHQIFVAGRELRITDNHPIATVNGWKTLREIKRSDAIIHVSQTTGELAWGLCVTQILPSKLSYLMGAGIVGTQIQKTQRIVDIFLGLGLDCTGMYGSSTTGRYPTGMISTTLTKTRQTTILATLSVYLRKFTGNYGRINRLNTQGQTKYGNILSLFGRKLRYGINPQRGGNGIGSTQKIQLPKQIEKQFMKKCQSLKERAKNVGRSFLAKLLKTSYALPCVQVNGIVGTAEKLSWQSPTYAKNVNASSTQYKQKQFFVGKNAETITIGQHVTEKVYNLSVEGAECYYANGVLVHNCDTTVMALSRFRNGGFIRLPSDEPEDVRYFKSRSGNRYY